MMSEGILNIMEILQLKYFITAAKCEHITKAAELLRIAQPALTQSIKRLEAELGVNLFERSGRNIVLNDAGRLMLSRAEGIIEELESLPEEIRVISGMSEGTVHMNVAAASLLVTKIIIEYKKLHPRLNISVTHGDGGGRSDISLTTSGEGSGTLAADAFKTVIPEDIMLAVPSDSKYAKKGSVRLSEVSQEDFVSLTGSMPLREICDSFCISSGFLPHAAFESDSSEAVRELVAANMGIAFWPAFSWGPPMKENVSLVPITYPVCRRYIIISKNKSTSYGVQSDFYSYIVSEINNIRNLAERAYSI